MIASGTIWYDPMLDHEVRCWAIDRSVVSSDIMVLFIMSLRVLALLLLTLCPGLVRSSCENDCRFFEFDAHAHAKRKL